MKTRDRTLTAFVGGVLILNKRQLSEGFSEFSVANQ